MLLYVFFPRMLIFLQLLSEAITVARTSNDRTTLHHCTRLGMQFTKFFFLFNSIPSILRRLPQTIPGQKPVLHEIQPDLHPLEVLFDVSKLLDEQNVDVSLVLGESHSDVSFRINLYPQPSLNYIKRLPSMTIG